MLIPQEKLMLSCFLDADMYNAYHQFVNPKWFSPEAQQIWRRLCSAHKKKIAPVFEVLNETHAPTGAREILQDWLARKHLQLEIEERSLKLNDPQFLSYQPMESISYTSRRVLSSPDKVSPDCSTGIKKLDESLEGWYKKELNIIAAPPFGGKTHWLVYFATQAVKQKLKVVSIFCEDTPNRMAGYYEKAGCKLKDLVILDYSDNPPSIEEVGEVCQIEKPDVMIVDYIDLLRPIGKDEGKRFELEGLYQGLRQVANQNNCIMLSASQTDTTGFGLTEAKVIKRAICDVIIYWKDCYFNIDKARGRNLKNTSLYVIPNWDNFTVKERKGL